MVIEPKETIGQRIAKKRKERGLTQVQLAKLLFVSKQTVSKWERGINSVPAEALSKLSEILNTSVDWILTEKGTENFVFSNETGLSDESIEILKAWNKDFIPYVSWINSILHVLNEFPSFIISLNNYLNQPLEFAFTGTLNDSPPFQHKSIAKTEDLSVFEFISDIEPLVRLKIMDELKEMRDWRMKENEQIR